MRKMFSKNQIAVIAKNVVDSNEAIAWADSMSNFLSYDSEEGRISQDDTYFNYIYVESFNNIENEDGDSLQDKLDEKVENPTELSAIPLTFASSPEGYQLPDTAQENLTSEQMNDLKEKMLYWIKKGFIKTQGGIIHIQDYLISESYISMRAVSVIYSIDGTSGEPVIDTLEQFGANLSFISSSYKEIEIEY